MPKRFLGRKKPTRARLATLATLAAITAQLPTPPPSVDYTAGKAWAGTMGNTTAGDCTLAGVGHLIQGFSACNGGSLAVADDEALAAYSRLEGWDPKTGEPDDGMVETDVLDAWKSPGLFGVTLADYATINPRNITHIKQSIWVFGGVYLGLDLPKSAEQQTDAGKPWSVPWFSEDLGGHCVVGQRYDRDYLYVDTWGELQAVEWAFVLRYFDAAYAPYCRLWLDSTGHTPGGLDAAGLAADLFAVAN